MYIKKAKFRKADTNKSVIVYQGSQSPPGPIQPYSYIYITGTLMPNTLMPI